MEPILTQIVEKIIRKPRSVSSVAGRKQMFRGSFLLKALNRFHMLVDAAIRVEIWPQ